MQPLKSFKCVCVYFKFRVCSVLLINYRRSRRSAPRPPPPGPPLPGTCPRRRAGSRVGSGGCEFGRASSGLQGGPPPQPSALPRRPGFTCPPAREPLPPPTGPSPGLRSVEVRTPGAGVCQKAFPCGSSATLFSTFNV